MALTPEEIVGYDLKQSVRGYSVAQVDDLLDQLADQVEAAQQQQERLTARLREAEQRLEATQETESTLKRTLITAQQAAERSLQEAKDEAEAMLDRARQEAAEVEQDARQEAERVLADARASASREAEEARRRRAALQERVDELVERERRHRAHLRELLEHQLAELERMGPLEDDLASAVGDEETGRAPGSRTRVRRRRPRLSARRHRRGRSSPPRRTGPRGDRGSGSGCTTAREDLVATLR
jgi:DivIVA domain-containing protein